MSLNLLNSLFSPIVTCEQPPFYKTLNSFKKNTEWDNIDAFCVIE